MVRYRMMAVVSATCTCCRCPLFSRQGAEAEMAVCLEWAHSQLFGQGKSLLIVDGSLLACSRLPPCGNIAEEMQGISLVATFLVLTGERQRPLGEGCTPPPDGQPAAVPFPARDYRAPESLSSPLPWSVPSPL